MAEKSAISAALRRRLFIVKIDVPQKSGKNSKTILRLKVRKVRKIRYAAAGISRYRLINVAPNPGTRASGEMRGTHVSTHPKC